MKSRLDLFPVLVKFSKTFTEGHLKGITIPQELNFVSLESASCWVDGILANERKGTLGWKFKLL